MERCMDAQEFVTRVIEGLNEALAKDPTLSLSGIAEDLCYKTNTLQQFRAGNCRSVRLATEVALLLPDVHGGTRCPHCGSLPTLTYERSRT